MKSPFEAFLRSEELDDTLKLHGQITKLNEEEERTALAVLESWSDKQAVSNLLFYPTLIPAANRERFFIKGLSDLKNPYIVLAAVVGVVCLAEQTVADDTRSEIKRRLLSICKEYGDAVGERASVSLRPFLEKKDLLAVLPLLSGRNNIIRQNTVTWIVRTWDKLTQEKMSEEFGAAGLSWFQRRRVLKAVHEFVQQRPQIHLAFRTAPLLAYIPNLKDVEQ